MTNQQDEAKAEDAHEHSVNIQIDRVHYQVHVSTMTGAQLRALPSTPIPPDRDLFLVVPGGTDRKIADGESLPLHNGARFFTAPGQINPGCQMVGHMGEQRGAAST
ncbi:multiubiquitin domain-containing protein [Variovorax paradoxus]|uniref:multiubiquitin domain-containing protein n=1 Tax=Variovorax paradoxus TaxID=34073 RepID=UPI003ECC7CC3